MAFSVDSFNVVCNFGGSKFDFVVHVVIFLLMMLLLMTVKLLLRHVYTKHKADFKVDAVR